MLKFDYYYGTEAEQFAFYRIPKALIKDKRFKGLSSDAKILYGLMLDRMALSMKNGWMDKENRVYIYYTIEDIMEDLGISRPTCAKIMSELDSKKGIGLIEKKKRGQGKPDVIYVKNFSSIVDNSCEDAEKVTVSASEIKKVNVKKQKNLISRSKKSLPLEVKNFNPNYTDINNTEYSKSNLVLSSQKETDGKKTETDRMDVVGTYQQLVKDNIEYDHWMKYGEYGDRELVEEIYRLICDVVCVNRKNIRVGKQDYPYQLVKAQFLKIGKSHIEYVLERLRNTTSRIRNIRAYMITTLYNAPNTIKHYYQQQVNYDLYGDSG